MVSSGKLSSYIYLETVLLTCFYLVNDSLKFEKKKRNFWNVSKCLRKNFSKNAFNSSALLAHSCY